MFKLDFKGFKKIASDGATTTLKHPAGHQIRLAHASLHPKVRGQLAELPMLAEGGDPTQEHLMQGDSIPNKIEKEQVHKDKKQLHQSNPKLEESKKLPSKPHYDHGGQVASAKKTIAKEVPYESGGRVDASDAQDSQQPDADNSAPEADQSSNQGNSQPPVVINVGSGGVSPQNINPNAGQQAMEQQPHNMSPQEQSANAPGSQPYGTPSPEQEASKVLSQQPGVRSTASENAPNSSLQAISGKNPDSEGGNSQESLGGAKSPEISANRVPDIQEGYNKAVSGMEYEQKAQSALGNEQAKIENSNLQAERQNKLDFQNKVQELGDQYKDFIQDYKDSHIDPNHYWAQKNTSQKIASAIGLIMGGFGSAGGGSNQALQYLDKQIDNDIEAQKAELNTKNNLLSANLRQFGNMEDATKMTQLMQSGIVSAELRKAAAKSTDPMAKARLLKEVGEYEQSKAPEFLGLAMRRSLMGGNSPQQELSGRSPAGEQSPSSSLRQEDPASYVPYVVPEAHQKDVLKEIQQAENATKNSGVIMSRFDQASKENTIARTGAGHLRTPASVMDLKALFLPMVHDAEGRVNEYEAKTLDDLIPAPGDTSNKVNEKKIALQHFINQKRAAPTAKAYGIDLEKFQKTSGSTEAGLNSQQQSFLQWARQNPDNPKAKLVFQKLGINQ